MAMVILSGLSVFTGLFLIVSYCTGMGIARCARACDWLHACGRVYVYTIVYVPVFVSVPVSASWSVYMGQ